MGGKEHQCTEHFCHWLKQMTGCSFAAKLAGNLAVSLQLGDLTGLPVLEASIDAAGAEGKVAVLLFPRIRTAGGIIRTLNTLTLSDRWKIRRVDWGQHPRPGATQVGLRFTTADGHSSSAMGFAPLGCMPVTRRAPYVAIALWSGGKANDHKQSSGSNVGFIDAAPSMTLEKHDRMWATTENEVKTLLEDPAEDGKRLRGVAFCLPDTRIGELSFSNASPSQAPVP